MSEIKVNKISPRTNCGTVTLGDSGDTFTIPAGATITNAGTANGFGASGAISWQTSIKTTDFTAVSNEGYFVNTSGGSDITVTLPASPSAGNVVAIKDYARTFGTNKVIMARNGSNMDGNAANTNLETDGQSVTFVFMDSTKGWSFINEDITTTAGAAFIAATGGTVTTDGNFKVHTFTSPGTFCVSSVGNSAGSSEVSYLVVAGGGGSGGDSGGGGGAGGFREGKTPQCTYTQSPIACTSGSNNGLPVAVAGYPVTVGAGGTAGAGNPPGSSPVVGGDGSVSTFAGTTTITSAGGGGGGSRPSPNGRPGGSGGGARSQAGSAGSGNTPPVTPSQGFDGGGATPTPTGNSGGGGGATALGVYNTTPACGAGGPGGNGATTQINGSATTFAGGGGGGGSTGPAQVGGTGGTGGGGDGVRGSAGGAPATVAGNPGTTNTGGGGGGGGDDGNGGSGGSGIVIIRYRFQ